MDDIGAPLPPLAGILVTHCRPGLLAGSLAAVMGQTLRPTPLVVVDNDPSESARAVVLEFEGTVYVPSGANLGPAGGLSLGMKHLPIADPNGWIAFFDDDDPPDSPTELADLLAFAVSAKRTHPRLGAVGLIGARYDRRRGTTTRVADEALEGVVEVDAIGGGMIPIYRAEALAQSGGPDPSLFFGLEELDLGLRLRRHGWVLAADGAKWLERRRTGGRINLTPAAIRSTTRSVPWREYYNTRNQILVARRHGTRLAVVNAVAIGLARAARSLLRRDGAESVHLVIRGVGDAVLGRSGMRVQPPAAVTR